VWIQGSFLCSQEVASQAESVSLSGYTLEGHKKWDLLAQSAEILPGADNINLENPKGILYDNGDPEVYLNSKTGVYNPKTGNILLEENVIMEAVTGAKVETSKLVWDSETVILEMENDIKMIKDNALLTGKGMKVFKDKHLAILKHNAKLKVFNESLNVHPSVITCTGEMEVNYQENFVEFHDNVVISNSQVNLKADYMKVFIDRKSKKLDKVVCKGDVLIVQDTKRALCGQAEYDALEGYILLTENPRIFRDGNILTAEMITFYLEDERVICKPSAQLLLFISDEDREFFEL
jgi:LPS export ABC transporter protein LptC/lipopolysaccharide transport protein LptA